MPTETQREELLWQKDWYERVMESTSITKSPSPRGVVTAAPTYEFVTGTLIVLTNEPKPGQ